MRNIKASKLVLINFITELTPTSGSNVLLSPVGKFMLILNKINSPNERSRQKGLLSYVT